MDGIIKIQPGDLIRYRSRVLRERVEAGVSTEEEREVLRSGEAYIAEHYPESRDDD